MTLKMTLEEKAVYQKEKQAQNWRAWKQRQIDAGVWSQKKKDYKIVYYTKLINSTNAQE